MINEPWVTLGDFHSILYSIDRINGQEVETRDFLEYVTTNNIKELHSSGWYYSWSNKGLGVGRVKSRIDRALGNNAWMGKYSDIHAKYMNPALSDHCPVILNCTVEEDKGGRPFRFLNYMADHNNFDSVVGACWAGPFSGSAMAKVWHKLKRVKAELKQLHKEEFRHIHDRIEMLRSDLDEVQSQLQMIIVTFTWRKRTLVKS